MNDKVYIGIDLGKNGGICFMINDHITEIYAMPLDSENELDILRLKTILTIYPYKMNEVCVVFERITPLHLASAKANWSLALQSGAVEALCVALELPFKAVPPKEWQKYIFTKLPPLRTDKGFSDTKGLALFAVQTLFPDQKLTDPLKPRATVPHDGIVDAICLAEFGRKNKL